MSVLPEIQTKLNGKQFRLLYDGEEDGLNAKTFHERCDGKGPTLTILHGKHNTWFGGYTEASWSPGKNKAKADKKAFLLYKFEDDKSECKFLTIKDQYTSKAITCSPILGPTFGCSKLGNFQTYDLQTFKDGDNTLKFKDGLVTLNGKLKFGESYELEDKNTKDELDNINSGTLIVKQIQVFQVVDLKISLPWREKLTDERAYKIRTIIERLQPPKELPLFYYNILLIGMINAGKSSFVNTLATVFQRSVRHCAIARDFESSVTNEVNAYVLSTKQGADLCIRLFDIRGFEDARGYDQELTLLLDGRLPVGYKFKDQPPQTFEENLADAHISNEIHLVCFVMGNCDADSFSPDIQQKIKDIQKAINQKGLPMVAVVTKLDEAYPEIQKDASEVFNSFQAFEALQKITKLLGIQQNQTFAVVNYVGEERNDKEKDSLALQALHTMVKLIREHLQKFIDAANKPDNWSNRAKKLHVGKNKEEIAKQQKRLKKQMFQAEKKVRILCVGPANSGKTSFIDSLDSALKGEVCSRAAAKGNRGHSDIISDSKTRKFLMFKMKYTNETEDVGESTVFIGDTPGIQKDGGVKLDNIKEIIQGNVKSNCEIAEGIEDRFRREEAKSNEYKVHCVCLVFDIKSPEKITENQTRDIKSLQRWLSEKGIPYVVILTKGDLLNPAVAQNKITVFEDKTVKENKDKLIEMFHFNQRLMFPVINYTDERDVVPESDALLLDAFFEILKGGNMYLESLEEDEED